jgi:glucose/arabinose dehydrogenase
MRQRTQWLFAIALWLITVGLVYVLHSSAHAPWAPYDDTVFAPITHFGPRVKVELVADGLTAPLKGVVAPGLPHYLFIVDQPGQVVALNLSTGEKSVFLDVGTTGLNLLVPLGVFFGPHCPPDQPTSGPSFDARGLLGLAFHPHFATNRKFYTYTSEPVSGAPTFPTTLPEGTPPDHQSVLSEWTAADAANPAAGVTGGRRVLMRVDWPQFSHIGGDLAFGPDNMLYISMGDGGGEDDRDGQDVIVPGTCGAQTPIVGHGEGNAQNVTNPLGKIHRIDVDGRNADNGQYGLPSDNPFMGLGGVIQEIFAFGFRDPFRFAFDTATGRLLVGDIGQNDLEEVNLVVSGGNYGWSRKEGTLCFNPNSNDPGFAFAQDPCPDAPPTLIDPIAQYDSHHDGHSVIGGFVYRGSLLPELHGHYIFGDIARLTKFPAGPNDHGRLFHLRPPRRVGGALERIREFQSQGGNALGLAILGFGQDAAGEIYVLGNVSAVPFGTQGVALKLTRPDD